MKKIEIICINLTHYIVKINYFFVNRYLWKSSKTEEIYQINDIHAATLFATSEEAMLCAEEFFNINKKS